MAVCPYPGPLQCPHHGTLHLPPVQAGIVDLSRFLSFSLIPVSSFFLQNLSETENTLPTLPTHAMPAPYPRPSQDSFRGFLGQPCPLFSQFSIERKVTPVTPHRILSLLCYKPSGPPNLNTKSLQCSGSSASCWSAQPLFSLLLSGVRHSSHSSFLKGSSSSWPVRCTPMSGPLPAAPSDALQEPLTQAL